MKNEEIELFFIKTCSALNNSKSIKCNNLLVIIQCQILILQRVSNKFIKRNQNLLTGVLFGLIEIKRAKYCDGVFYQLKIDKQGSQELFGLYK